MKVGRLKTLHRALVAHAKKPGNLKFDLRDWLTFNAEYGNVAAIEVVTKAKRGENFCGTAACALGLAAALPAFTAMGLRFTGGCSMDDRKYVGVEFQGKHGFEAAVEFFDIGYGDAEELFSGERYSERDSTDPLAVADRITAMLHTT